MKLGDKTCQQELSYDDDTGEITTQDGRMFRPLYKHLLDNMPRDLVQEMARRRALTAIRALAKFQFCKSFR